MQAAKALSLAPALLRRASAASLSQPPPHTLFSLTHAPPPHAPPPPLQHARSFTTAAAAAARAAFLARDSVGFAAHALLRKKEKGGSKGGKKKSTPEGSIPNTALIEKNLYKEVEEKMHEHLNAMMKNYSTLTVGKSETGLLDNLMVEVYETTAPLSTVAQVVVKDSQTLAVNVFDPEIVKACERAIHKANLGFSPQVSGLTITVQIPKVSQELRREVAKSVSNYTEMAKVGIRRVRKDGMDEAKGLEKTIAKDDIKRMEKFVQNIHDKFIQSIDKLHATKEKEILRA